MTSYKTNLVAQIERKEATIYTITILLVKTFLSLINNDKNSLRRVFSFWDPLRVSLLINTLTLLPSLHRIYSHLFFFFFYLNDGFSSFKFILAKFQISVKINRNSTKEPEFFSEVEQWGLTFWFVIEIYYLRCLKKKCKINFRYQIKSFFF